MVRPTYLSSLVIRSSSVENMSRNLDGYLVNLPSCLIIAALYDIFRVLVRS